MQCYSLPARIRALAFDIDKTLYDNDAYAEHQIDVLIERLARERSLTVADARSAIDAWQRAYAETHGGARQSLGNTFSGLGVPMETSIVWREELICPEEFLSPDDRLAAVMDALATRYRLIAVTNNPVLVGRATLEALGVASFFPQIVGLDSTLRSKPDPAPFVRAAEMLDVEPHAIVSVGDRYDVDIAPALSVGMGGVLVEGVRDVYVLPKRLEQGANG